jgi:hypothetical protein
VGIKYYACWIRLNGRDWYLIWISSEPEAILVNTDRRIPVFTDELFLMVYAKANGIEIEDQKPILHNLDAVEQWLPRMFGCLEFVFRRSLRVKSEV